MKSSHTEHNSHGKHEPADQCLNLLRIHFAELHGEGGNHAFCTHLVECFSRLRELRAVVFSQVLLRTQTKANKQQQTFWWTNLSWQFQTLLVRYCCGRKILGCFPPTPLLLGLLVGTLHLHFESTTPDGYLFLFLSFLFSFFFFPHIGQREIERGRGWQRGRDTEDNCRPASSLVQCTSQSWGAGARPWILVHSVHDHVSAWPPPLQCFFR